MRRAVIPPLQPIPRRANIGERDMIFLKYAAELQQQNPDYSGWIAQQAADILKRRLGRSATRRRA